MAEINRKMATGLDNNCVYMLVYWCLQCLQGIIIIVFNIKKMFKCLFSRDTDKDVIQSYHTDTYINF